MGFTHQQQKIRDSTIDARPNDPNAITDPLIALNYLIEVLEARIVRLEGLALRDAVTEVVTRNAVTRDAKGDAGDAGDAQRVTRDAAIKRHAHTERQRRYRERKKAHGADPQR